jgi:GTP-binding protein
VLDVSADPENDFATVRHEVAQFDDEMIERPALIALNKADLVAPEESARIAEVMRSRTGLEVFVISAEHGAGLDPLVEAIAAKLRVPFDQPDTAAADPR